MDIESIAASLLLGAALITDLGKQRIPNLLSALFFAAGLVFHVVAAGTEGLLSASLEAATGFVPLLLLYWAKGIGAGDVKLFGAVGVWIGAGQVLQLMLYSFLYAGGIAAVLLAVRRITPLVRGGLAEDGVLEDDAGGGEDSRNWMRRGKTFPFMLAVAPAALSIWLTS